MKKFFLMLFGVAVFIAVIGYFTGTTQKGQQSSLKEFVKDTLSPPKVKINNLEIKVEIADTEDKRRQGLSGRDSLAESSGMLFVFEGKSSNPFWMKEMRFPIDIIWIDEGKIIGIERGVQPQPDADDQELKLYYPPQQVSRVLEVNAGFSETNKIEVGQTIELPSL